MRKVTLQGDGDMEQFAVKCSVPDRRVRHSHHIEFAGLSRCSMSKRTWSSDGASG